MSPNPPLLLLPKPHQLLQHNILRAIPLLSRRSILRLNGSLVNHAALIRGQLDFARGLAAGDAEDDLAHAGFGDFGYLGCAVREDADAGEEGCGGPVVFIEGPGYSFVFGADGDAGGEAVGKAGTADLSEGCDVASVVKSVVNRGPRASGKVFNDTYSA